MQGRKCRQSHTSDSGTIQSGGLLYFLAHPKPIGTRHEPVCLGLWPRIRRVLGGLAIPSSQNRLLNREPQRTPSNARIKR